MKKVEFYAPLILGVGLFSICNAGNAGLSLSVQNVLRSSHDPCHSERSLAPEGSLLRIASYYGTPQIVTHCGVPINTITVSPSSVAGGSSSQGTVTLSWPAPAAGASVALSSSNTTLATVPTSITVPAGVLTATFTVTTSTVTVATTISISGASGGITQAASLTLTPSYSLAASPSTLAPGATITVTWGAPSGHSATDWIALFPIANGDYDNIGWQYVPAGTSGTMTFTAPSTLGSYEFRYFTNGTHNKVATSNTVTVSP